MSNKRLSPQKDEWIDRNHEITFNFEGEKITGYKGDVITSALVPVPAYQAWLAR